MSFWISNPSMIFHPLARSCVCLLVCSLLGLSSWTGWLHSRRYKKRKRKVMVELLQTVREGGWGRVAPRFDWSVCPETQ